MIDLHGVSLRCTISACLFVLSWAQVAIAQDRTDGWKTADPESVGFDSEQLKAMTLAIESGSFGDIHAVLIERAGMLVYEEYFSGNDESWGRPLGRVDFDAYTKHDLRSVTKSVISVLVGIAVARDHIGSTELPLSVLLPGHSHLLTGPKQDITLSHVLTMSSGLEWNEDLPYSDPRNDERRMSASEDPVAFVLERSLVEVPGDSFNYSGGSTQLLASILEETTDSPLEGFANEVLFEPLGIHNVEWLGDLNGVPSAASGLRMTARDLAKIGSLFLHGGKWNGVEVIPESWVREATRPHLELDTSSDPGFVLDGGYGYQWWYNEFLTGNGPRHVVAAVGNGGQRILLVPELDVAVTIFAGLYNDPDRFWAPEILLLQHVLPAVVNQE